MILPQKMMDEFKDEAQGCRFLGHKLEDFSKEELMVAVAVLGKQAQEEMVRSQHEIEMLTTFNRTPMPPPPPRLPTFGLFGLIR